MPRVLPWPNARYRTAAEIIYAAVLPGRRNTAIGTALVETCLVYLRAAGVRMVEVKTLDATSGYEPYIDREPGKPCAMYVRSLAP